MRSRIYSMDFQAKLGGYFCRFITCFIVFLPSFLQDNIFLALLYKFKSHLFVLIIMEYSSHLIQARAFMFADSLVLSWLFCRDCPFVHFLVTVYCSSATVQQLTLWWVIDGACFPISFSCMPMSQFILPFCISLGLSFSLWSPEMPCVFALSSTSDNARQIKPTQ